MGFFLFLCNALKHLIECTTKGTESRDGKHVQRKQLRLSKVVQVHSGSVVYNFIFKELWEVVFRKLDSLCGA